MNDSNNNQEYTFKPKMSFICFALLWFIGRHDKVSQISIAQLARLCARIFIISWDPNTFQFHFQSKFTQKIPLNDNTAINITDQFITQVCFFPLIIQNKPFVQHRIEATAVFRQFIGTEPVRWKAVCICVRLCQCEPMECALWTAHTTVLSLLTFAIETNDECEAKQFEFFHFIIPNRAWMPQIRKQTYVQCKWWSRM